MTRWSETAGQGAEAFGTGTPTGDRLHTTSQFFELLGHDMTQAAEHWRQVLAVS